VGGAHRGPSAPGPTLQGCSGRWQLVGDFSGSGIKPHTSLSRSKRLTT